MCGGRTGRRHSAGDACPHLGKLNQQSHEQRDDHAEIHDAGESNPGPRLFQVLFPRWKKRRIEMLVEKIGEMRGDDSDHFWSGFFSGTRDLRNPAHENAVAK